MTGSAHAHNRNNVAAQVSFDAVRASTGASRAWAHVRAFLVRRRTFLGIVVAFGLLAVADPKPWALAAGLVLVTAAHALRLISAGYLDKNETLVTRGPFAWCRNPLYVGNYLVSLGFSLMSGQWLAIPLVLGLCTATQVPTVACEEEYLRRQFGAEFERYRERVPAWIPRRPGRGGNAIPANGGEFSWSRVVENQEHLNVISAWLIVAMFVIEMVK